MLTIVADAYHRFLPFRCCSPDPEEDRSSSSPLLLLLLLFHCFCNQRPLLLPLPLIDPLLLLLLLVLLLLLLLLLLLQILNYDKSISRLLIAVDQLFAPAIDRSTLSSLLSVPETRKE